MMSTQTLPPQWQEKVDQKRRQCQALLPAEWTLSADQWRTLVPHQQPLESTRTNLIALDIPRRSGILTERELHITEAHSVSRLLDDLARGQLSSLEVTTAFCKRAALAQQLTSCLTETFFDQALERARQLDAQREQVVKAGKGRQALGPLHGLPISIKDSFQVRGTAATLGFVSGLDQPPSTENSCLVDVLLGLGAVLYCKTNVPQTLMTADSHNHVFGRTLNPWNTSLTAGGSSGGEGALLAFRGSPLGVGTDVAGSIRIPALCCGLYGFKPTAARIPYGNQAPLGMPGLPTITPSAGPLANDLTALEIFLRAVLDARPARIDSTALDLPWRQLPPTTRKLRLALLSPDPLFPLHPPVAHALAAAADLLRAAGHEIIPLTAAEGRVAVAYDIAGQMFALDKSSAPRLKAGAEPMVPSMVAGSAAGRKVAWDRSEVPETRRWKDGVARVAALQAKRTELKARWRAMWTAKGLDGGLDGVVAPGAQNTAVEHDAYGLAPYTGLFNLLDYPACSLPFGRVTKAHLQGEFELPTGSVAPPYHPENLEGAPLSIQLATTTLRDEECLALARVVDQCLNSGAASARI